MDTAIRYAELMQTFTTLIAQQTSDDVEVFGGRRFDRVTRSGIVSYFVDKESWTIYGAKSAAQYNPRREYGTLETVTQFDWAAGAAVLGTVLAQQIDAREAAIAAGYKQRGRPKKVKP